MRVICSQRVLRLSNESKIHIPFGLSRFYKYALSSVDTVLTTNADKVVCIKINEKMIQVYPYYCKDVSIPELPRLTFSVVVTEKDKKACAALVSKVHYLSSPNRGVFFALKNCEEIVACCILDTLRFGNPKGRYYIDEKLCESLDISYKNWGGTPHDTHNILQNQLELIWVSRIAKAQEYGKYRIGTVLMQEVLKAIPVVLPFPVKHVEIIRTCGVKDALSRDFLEYAGFTKKMLRKQTIASYVSDGDLFPELKAGVKFYYWKKIENISSVENARLFVPLSHEPFSWFADNKKTWELRRSRGQFTKRHIYVGRPVELRLGYNTDKKLWGMVNRVIVGSSIESVLAEIGDFQSVIPIASSMSDTAKKAKDILKTPSDSYIAFEITAIFNPDDLTCHV